MGIPIDPLLTAVLIFFLRIIDVSIGTIRVIYTIRGHKMVASSLGAIEAFIWIFAISRAFKSVDHPISMIGWALGFAAGTAIGIALEQWIGTGSVLVRPVLARACTASAVVSGSLLSPKPQPPSLSCAWRR